MPAVAVDGLQTWRHLQVREEMENRRPSFGSAGQRASVSFSGPPPEAAGGGNAYAPGRTLLGVSHRAPPQSSYPLGGKSYVPTLGTNMKDLYNKKRFATSSKFTNSFDQDHWF